MNGRLIGNLQRQVSTSTDVCHLMATQNFSTLTDKTTGGDSIFSWNLVAEYLQNETSRIAGISFFLVNNQTFCKQSQIKCSFEEKIDSFYRALRGTVGEDILKIPTKISRKIIQRMQRRLRCFAGWTWQTVWPRESTCKNSRSDSGNSKAGGFSFCEELTGVQWLTKKMIIFLNQM